MLVLGTPFVLLKMSTFLKRLKVNTITLQYHQIIISSTTAPDASSSSIADGIDLALSMLVQAVCLFDLCMHVLRLLLCVQHAGLIGIIEEIDSLHKLVQAAASAATNCGSLLSLDSSTRLKSRSESGRVQEQKSKAGNVLYYIKIVSIQYVAPMEVLMPITF